MKMVRQLAAIGEDSLQMAPNPNDNSDKNVRIKVLLLLNFF